ncbi:MAG TPA: sigma-70 family RNA polymerase sigma factor [Pseudonocardiaceae bacterium]|nr:sigma-70 family RNA polymerase sigma factor [Pseudonocardiaceae bacterium]
MFQPPPADVRVSGRDEVEPSTEARLETLVEEHRIAVFNYARRLTCGDADWAEDVVQETFLRAWRHRKHLTPEHGSIRGWLMRVAHNLVMDGYRSARMRHGELPLDEAFDIAMPESTDQILTAHVVGQALYQLPAPQRQALEATYLSDRTTAQAARALNVPVGTVKSRVFYGLRMLRSIIQTDPPAAA